MRTLMLLPALIALTALPLLAQGDTPAAPQPPPIPRDYTPTPAAPEQEAAAQPEVSARSEPNGDLVEEYRIRGQLYMIKITPRNGEPYYLVDEEGNRQFRRSNSGELRDPLTPPQWVLKRW